MLTAPKKFVVLERVDSTNNYAMGMVQNGDGNSGDAVFALEQTEGKGRRNKAWKSGKRQGILLSMIIEMQWLPVLYQFRVSVAAALGCYDFVSKYIKKDVKIKWPNDIFINDRKAGGILIENVLKGNLWQWSIIGIGVNVNQQNFETQDFQASSLRQLTGQVYDVVELGKELHEDVLARINQLQNGGYNEMLEEYNANLFARNKQVKLRKGNIVFETTVQSVPPSGELITKDAIERSFGFDEVEWLL
ncbi:MAG: biotin--[acetyl-CoA-carboxylase] ligase [Bacteroidota bacterium]|nr:biotin--[acetyl-CoA-carboxylase] ligase [Bacteroidota bacterium]